ncbi:MAG: 2-C-methyl-D-erythritol 2,4-cyclodiphosphate synthase [Bacteroidia bacterium]|nr:2-C-methyl-D-erythritol 2,4-cyclodiphosphate synthase [Bacteroidia bacterium]
MNIRIGFGYDVHRLTTDRKLILGGVEIPFELGLLGHSDADVLLHAICDALLGAANLRDIGFHFPDTDPNYKNADSKILLRDSYQLVKKEGYTLGNLDCTIIAEKPKINPHVPEMRKIIADILDTSINNISIKATTNEQLDAIGNLKGIAVHAVALIVSGVSESRFSF